MYPNHQTNLESQNEGLNLRLELEKYLRHWKWFLFGALTFISLAWVYVRYTAPSYMASASILIKDNKKSGISAELAAFEDLGIIGGSANNTDNEIEILKSRRIIGLVVDSLKLNVRYSVLGRVIESEVYKHSNPIKFDFSQNTNPLNTDIDTTFFISPINDISYHLLDADNNTIGEFSFGETVETSFGEFEVFKNKNFTGNKFLQPIRVSVAPKYLVIDSYREGINIEPVNKNSSVLHLTLNGAVRKKTEDVLNEIINQYNFDAKVDKNQVAEKTKDFIDGRLKKVQSDLYLIDKEVKEFKTDKDFSGLPVEVEMAFESLKETTTKITEVKVSLAWTEEIRKILSTKSSNIETLPSSLGFTDEGTISSAISTYNSLILEIKRVQITAGVKNPNLLKLENQRRSLQSSLLESLANLSNSLKLQLREAYNDESKVLSKVRSFPENERGYIDIAREQEIISGLYQYLLKKKEETDISLAVTVPNAKIIDSAYSSKIPVSPRKSIIYLAALLLGVIIPFVCIYVMDLLDTKIHSKQDVESQTSVPFLGDVPRSDTKEKIVFKNDIRSSTSEAFRLIRTKLDFMFTDSQKQCKSIFVTSTTSGEGKSFISINLAVTMASAGNKVLLLGMDLRAPKVTEYLNVPNRKGVTNYIKNEKLTLEDLIFPFPDVKGADVIVSGAIPPNPAELLLTKRVENLFLSLKKRYDVIIVDTAPVNLVTDTLLISKYADMFIYVVRANYLDKRLLNVPQELYNSKKLPNISIVLNDTNPKRSYGYGYGDYGYGYVIVKKPWYKKILRRNS